MVDAYPRKAEPVVIELSTAEVERSLGMALGVEQVAGILRSLEFVCEVVGTEPSAVVRVKVPEHRTDCELPADLIEEVARIYGYDRMPVTTMADRLPPQRGNRDLELEEAVRDILVACGLQEVITYTLTTVARESALLASSPQEEGSTADTHLALTNPITQERAVLRQRLLTTVLETAASNLHYRDRVALFEVGKVFLPVPGDDLPAEPRRLSMVMCGPREGRHWLASGGPELDFFDLKGVVETLLARLHVANPEYEPAQAASFQQGRVARLRVGEADIGVLGEVTAAVRDAFGLPNGRVAAAELDLEALLAQVPSSWFVQPVSSYPAVLQDLAVIVDDDVPASRVQKLIAEAGGALLKEVNLFDLYRGEPIPAGKKSLAFSLSFQSPGKTLSDDLVAKQVMRIVVRLKKEIGAEIRGA